MIGELLSSKVNICPRRKHLAEQLCHFRDVHSTDTSIHVGRNEGRKEGRKDGRKEGYCNTLCV